MDLRTVLAQRRMVRSFKPEPIARPLIDALLDDALRAPTAGNAAGVAFVVLEGDQCRRYWDSVTTAQWRSTSSRYEGLSRAPVVVVVVTSPQAYLARYREPDKADSGLGDGSPEAWPVPYWFGDAAMAAGYLLLGVAEAALGACFLGNFRGEAELADAVGLPAGWRILGAVVIGHPDGGDHRSASLERPVPARRQRIHYGKWT